MAGGSKTSNPDLEDFLRRIDELESVVKGDESHDAVKEGSSSTGPGSSPNRRQQQSPVDRTVINKAAFKDETAIKGIAGGSNPALDQDGFLRSMEADANERAMKRKKRREEATIFKNQGNEKFKMGNFLRAVELYTQGLERSKDFTILYTNRAQALNKLSRFEEAKEDCHTALQLEPNHVKARIHLGKAYLGLKEYDTAVKTYQEILEIDQNQEKTVKGYIAAARLAESLATSALEAERLFNEGDTKATGVVQILSKLKQPHQPIPYYAGGFRILCTAINDCSSQALFRQYGGFHLLTNVTAISQCLDDAITCNDLSSDVEDLICVILEILITAVTDNIENSAFLVNLSVFPSLVLGLLRQKSEGGLRHRCVLMLSTLSKNAEGQSGIVKNVDQQEMLSLLVTFIQSSSPLEVRTTACRLLRDLATNKEFQSKFQYGADTHLIPAFTRLLVNTAPSEDSLLMCCLAMMDSMALNPIIRQAMYCNAPFVQAIVKIIETYSRKQEMELQRNVLLYVMNLLLNMCVKWTPRFDEKRTPLPIEGKVLFPTLLFLLDSGQENIRKRSLGILSHVLPFGDESLADVAKGNYIPKIIRVMRGGDLTCGHYGIKCLAVLTQRSDKARNDMVRTDPELQYTLGLLKTDSDVMIGNAALVLSHCTQVAGLSSSLVHTDIIKTLLSETDSSDESVKKNCAIAVAKLATTDQRHLEELRKLGGIGILHSCMKYIK
ncbi:tetratricopeptide repeat protein 12-like [Asterias rubens]|uniref:tetratricopeptide repeat protein 12-like n=1 Tax=Asterias rubens TaxID=7604 RepID=UPI001455D4A1|nr:tetratricopeptide repeat protein 12-like [Asterias rubens]